MAYQEQDARGRLWLTKLTTNDATPIEGAEKLGAIRELSDGRRFRYVQITGAAGALGRLYMPATLVAVTDATSANGTGPDGATTTIITDANASFTADAYINWHFQLATGMTGSTEPIKIVGNTATTLTLEKSIATALASGGTDDGEILAGNAAGAFSTTSDLDVHILGVGIGTITQNYYGWLQVRGIAAVISTSGITEGLAVSSGGGSTAGQAAVRGGVDDNLIGICVAAAGSNEAHMVDLCIA